MTVAKNIAYGAVALIFTGFYPQSALADAFKNKDFLQLEKEQKKYWVVASIEALSQAELAQNKKKAPCIADWFYKDVANKMALIEGYAKKYPDYTPASVMILLTRSACKIAKI